MFRIRCIACFLGVLALASFTHAQPTAFTYQGRLENDAALASGLHHFRFTLLNAAFGGTQPFDNTLTGIRILITSPLP